MLNTEEIRIEIEGCLPDLLGSLLFEEWYDAIYDFARDWIYDRNRDESHEEIVRVAAEIAVVYAGQKE